MSYSFFSPFQTHKEFAQKMLGGFNMQAAKDFSKKVPGRPFHPPSNVDLPAAVGRSL